MAGQHHRPLALQAVRTGIKKSMATSSNPDNYIKIRPARKETFCLGAMPHCPAASLSLWHNNQQLVYVFPFLSRGRARETVQMFKISLTFFMALIASC
jgi:hypothetical protein